MNTTTCTNSFLQSKKIIGSLQENFGIFVETDRKKADRKASIISQILTLTPDDRWPKYYRIGHQEKWTFGKYVEYAGKQDFFKQLVKFLEYISGDNCEAVLNEFAKVLIGTAKISHLVTDLRYCYYDAKDDKGVPFKYQYTKTCDTSIGNNLREYFLPYIKLSIMAPYNMMLVEEIEKAFIECTESGWLRCE